MSTPAPTDHHESNIKALMFLAILAAIPMSCIIGVIISLNIYSVIGNPEPQTSDYPHAFSFKWHKLPKPPEPVYQLAAARLFTVYVTTTDGNILGCYRVAEDDLDCWFEVKEIPKPLPETCSDLTWGFPLSNLKTQREVNVTSTIQAEYCGMWYGGSRWGEEESSAVQYALSDEGDVWQWGYDGLRLDDNVRNFESSRIYKPIRVGYLIGIGIQVITSIFIWKIGKATIHKGKR